MTIKNDFLHAVCAVFLGCLLFPWMISCSNEASAPGANADSASSAKTVISGKVKISEIQGSGAVSPYAGSTVSGVTGEVTLVCYKTAHADYDTVLMDGTTGPQYISEDGFFMESLPADKDLSGKKSNGIFVSTHDRHFTVSKWRQGFPTDLAPGDVVTVSGIVREARTENRFNSSNGYLTRTEIDADTLVHNEANGKYVTAPFPDGVLLTYTQAYADAWIAGHETDGFREARIMPFDDGDLSAAEQNAVNVLESVEGMFVRIDNPVVAGGTYYNITAVLADGGRKNGFSARTWNSAWSGNVIAPNDYNSELLFVDYQSPSWKTFSPLAQQGDHLADSAGKSVFRGVMDYTSDGLYMARPVNASHLPVSVTGAVIPAQGWDFLNDAAWYADSSSVKSAMATQSNALIKNTIKPWRTGTAAADQYNAAAVFTPSWNIPVTAEDTLTIASFNLENYEAQGGSYRRGEDLALIIKNNLLYPDVLVTVEMGDDIETPVVYDNQADSWAPRDGSVSAVRNFSGIIDCIEADGGPHYEFRQIDPVEQESGGAPGVNIRVGFLYNTARVRFADRGIETDCYANTHDVSGRLLPAGTWPMEAPGVNATLLTEIEPLVYRDTMHKAHITQSPAYIQSPYFKNSRNPLAGEFRFIKAADADGTVTDYETFFVVACHLCSKGGDYPLYGEIQPPLLVSEYQRSGQAAAVNAFVQKILALDSTAKVFVAGDMNDFAWAHPLKVLDGTAGGHQILWNVSEQFMPVQEQFSYSYQGNLQEIDHIYISESPYSAIAAAGAADWKNVCFIPHIDSLFSRNNHINFSDHDPIVVRLTGVF